MSEHTQELAKKMCNHCYCNKTIDNFYYASGDNNTYKDNDTYNQYAEKKKSKWQENLASSRITPTSSDNFSSAIFNNSATIAPKVSNITTANFGNNILNDFNTIIPNDSSNSIYNKSEHNVQSYNNLEVLMYDLDEMHKIITKKFKETEKFDNPVNFALEVKLSHDLFSEFL
ncbi:14252_t:CDS:2 [Racocetra fulgida]|uniref:14252_t:CDS:1 n=1 Tax=Racocetra fulgida TaxID=60492 RepID=A0A9N8WLX2_9GLOM|nr:14252_t:CDS:2 [Racocetra fulgida]